MSAQKPAIITVVTIRAIETIKLGKWDYYSYGVGGLSVYKRPSQGAPIHYEKFWPYRCIIDASIKSESKDAN